MKNFEEYAKNQLDQHPSQVDLGGLWAKIDADLRPEPRRVPPVFWWSAVCFLVGVAVAGFFFFGNFETGKTTPATESNLMSPVAVTPISTENQQAATTSPTTPVFENQKQAAEKPTAHFSKLAGKSASQPSSSGTANFSKNQAGSPSFLKISDPENLPASQPTARQSVENQNFDSTSDKFSEKFAAAKKLPSGLIWLKNKTRPDPKIGCYNFGRGKRGGGGNFAFKPYFGVYGGAQLPLKTLKTSNSEFENLVAQRDATEKTLEGWQVGGYVGSRIAGGVFGEIGLEFNRINERFEAVTTRRDTTGQVVTTGFFVQAPGDTLFFKDTVNIVQTTKTTKRTFNNYRTLQLPIALGYEWNNGGRWTTYLKLGAMINLKFSQKAEIINLAGDPQLYKSEDVAAGHPFRTKLGVSPFVNLGTRFGLTEQLSVFGEVRYLQPLSKITADDYPLEQKYRLPGANLGLHFQF